MNNPAEVQDTPSSAPSNSTAHSPAQSHRAPLPAVHGQQGSSPSSAPVRANIPHTGSAISSAPVRANIPHTGGAISSAPVRANTPHTGGTISNSVPTSPHSPRPPPPPVAWGRRATSPTRPVPAPAAHGQDGQHTRSAGPSVASAPQLDGTPQHQQLRRSTRAAAGRTGSTKPAPAARRRESRYTNVGTEHEQQRLRGALAGASTPGDEEP